MISDFADVGMTPLTNENSGLNSLKENIIIPSVYVRKLQEQEEKGRIVLTLARKKHYEDLPTFSGHSSDDTERFLKSIKVITTSDRINDDSERLQIVRGKLTHSAGRWFDDDQQVIKTWD
ncbi:unnamed protein product [Didymodactylos carnosus]|uniref:Uncharacterized protein n=2 Tax=Didymodactylos carnosus TaxID=1234261 RepID=A0A814SPA0_9BILA|nr:unnamed protein product [Didymodactylos carnosus]CAF3914001.1 unnamed protein product [Didymodactylos carnosus]